MTTLSETLKERGKRYGAFDGHARITCELKTAMHSKDSWYYLSPDKKEALDMIAHKIGRILNGDPEYADSWVDIAGYAQLVADKINEEDFEEIKKCVEETIEELEYVGKKVEAVLSDDNFRANKNIGQCR